MLPSDGLRNALVWLGDEGRPLAAAVKPGGRLQADEAALQTLLLQLRKGPPNKLSIGRLMRDLGDPGVHWPLPVGRRVQGLGAQAAALVARVNLTALRRVLEAVDTGRNGFVTLFMNDGWMLATAPQNDSLLARNWNDSPMFKDLPARHAKTRLLGVANARHNPSYGCALRLDQTRFRAPLRHGRKTLGL